jgi:hypothetical protein
MEIVLFSHRNGEVQERRTAATNLKDIPLFSSSGGMVLGKNQAAQRGFDFRHKNSIHSYSLDMVLQTKALPD